jgi:hypothetical protein
MMMNVHIMTTNSEFGDLLADASKNNLTLSYRLVFQRLKRLTVSDLDPGSAQQSVAAVKPRAKQFEFVTFGSRGLRLNVETLHAT